MLEEALKKVAVLGAAGKMGSGISLLLLQEMAMTEAENNGSVGGREYRLFLIDVSDEALNGLRKYLRSQLQRFAEKRINALRTFFADHPKLVSNEDMIDAFVQGALDMVRLETEPVEAAHASLVFEAIVEDSDVKGEVFAKIAAAAKQKPYFFTNTSSIPICVLDEKGGLEGHIIGFHFYNPPPVQRLLEIIPAETTNPELERYAEVLAQRLNKVMVFSNDVAGFIGNGHFMREIDFACRKVKELESKTSRKEAVWMINRVTQDFLIRPMGIFQLLDYVGLDVCQKVLGIMRKYLDVPFEMEVIEDYLQSGLTGGQRHDGSQKDGIFRYEGPVIKQIWNGNSYSDLSEDHLGDLPEGHVPWKALHKDKNKEAILSDYFKNLLKADTFGARLAQEHLYKSREIARNLVSDGVARSVEDVNTVLQNGFYHLYGADNAWLPEKAESSA